jgi:hypothetical protein
MISLKNESLKIIQHIAGSVKINAEIFALIPNEDI